MRNLHLCLCYAVMLLLFSGGMDNSVAAASDPFPSYRVIQDNVAFWKKVYAEYPSSKGLIHDSQDLGVIYEVISLEENDCRDNAEGNERLQEAVKEKYRHILIALGQGRIPSNQEEKRVAALFGKAPSKERFTLAADNIRFQRCLRERFQAGLVRSGRYLEQIKAIFVQYGLPSDLAYLPHVESSYDYEAYSKAGAAGIWQLIPATGRRFLTISSAIDERRDPIIATHAAAKFLQGNYRKLESWPLALTAYNHGLTAMLRAKNTLVTYERIYQGYEGSRFGFASRNFYAEFLAAREIAKNHQKYFPGLCFDKPVQTKSVFLKNSINAKTAVGHFTIDAPTLAALNPAILETVWQGRRDIPRGYSLHLPQGRIKVGHLAATLPLATDSSPTSRQKSPQAHRVRPGDTIHAIAARYDVSASQLIAHNQLDRDAVIRVGQKLQIPPPQDERQTKKSKTRVASKNAAGH
ncbi:MAG: transglycosylase SLT domain-containing protein [Desulfobulbaceae bacterium]|nr:transglycosylase SLT domain-containing protein [Desulfobulbaceae bacterium]